MVAIRHLGFILEVDGRGWVANLCASDPPPPPPPPRCWKQIDNLSPE